MDYITALPLGFLIGMAHALEADHLAAVTTLQNQSDGRRTIFARGAIWGIGHTASLFAACLAVFFLGLTISGRVEAGLEVLVGLMIAMLGGHVLWKLHREKIHIHVHDHSGDRHIHVHSHGKDATPHENSAHQHRHKTPNVSSKGFVFSVGMMHGLAGSAGFLVLMSATAESVWQALGYLSFFGVGSIIGMACLTAAISLPLGRLQRVQGWLPAATKAAIGIVAIFVGGLLAVESWQVFASTGV